MSITIVVDGVEYTGFTPSVQVTKSIEDFCGSFTFDTVSSTNVTFPIKVGQSCQIFVEGQQVINGFVEQINVNYSASDHAITINGRDRTCDIIDSTLGENLEFTAPFTLKQIIEKVLSILGLSDIKVLQNVVIDSFTDADKGESAMAMSAFDFIEEYARLRQVLITTTGDGNIELYRTQDAIEYSSIISLEPQTAASILNASANYDITRRYNKYIARSQQNDGALDNFTEQDVESGTDVFGQKIDKDIRSSRVYNFFAENPLKDNTEAVKRAKWEANYRKSQGFIYNVVLRGFIPLNDQNTIWQPNRLIQVDDPFADILSTLLISNVQYNFSLTEGSRTSLKLVSRDAFTLELERPRHEELSETEGTRYYEGAE